MVKQYKFGHKVRKKSWKQEEIDKEWEDKKILLVFGGIILMFILLGMFMWWMKSKGV